MFTILIRYQVKSQMCPVGISPSVIPKATKTHIVQTPKEKEHRLWEQTTLSLYGDSTSYWYTDSVQHPAPQAFEMVCNAASPEKQRTPIEHWGPQ